MPHPSIHRLWRAYLATLGETPATTDRTYEAWHFCDTEPDANECLRLVLDGVKRATSPALWWLEDEGLDVPSVGDLDIITDWDGKAHGIIRTTRVDIVRFQDVTAEYAAIEGEGDGSLKTWGRIHRAYYRREAEGRPYTFSPGMPIVCQRFQLVFRKNADRQNTE